MTRNEMIKLFNGLRNGTRPIRDIFADWPTETFVKYITYPGHIETPLGKPVSPIEVNKIEKNYPKVHVFLLGDPIGKVIKRLRAHVARGREIFVPIIGDDEEDAETQNETTQNIRSPTWASITTETYDKPDEFIDEVGTRMVKKSGPDKYGKTTYEGFSERYLEKFPDAYEKLLNGEDQESAQKQSEIELRPMSHRPWDATKSADNEFRPLSQPGQGAEKQRESKTNPCLRHVYSLINEIPEYLLPARDPYHWEILPHPSHPGLFIWDEIVHEPPLRKYNMRW